MRGGCGGLLIEILILQALAQARLEPLNEALAAADPEGYRRVFIDSAPLIPGWLARPA